MSEHRTDREMALHAGVVLSCIVLGSIIIAVCYLLGGCSGSDTIKETRYVESDGLSLGRASTTDGGYATILPYGGYTAIGRDGAVLSTASEGSCCGTGITITQTQESEGDADQNQNVSIDQSTSGGEGGGTEQTVIDELTTGPSAIEAIDGNGVLWTGEAGTHVLGKDTPIHLVNQAGDTLTGKMSRHFASGLPLRLTYIPADGGAAEDVVLYRTGFHTNYSVE